MNNLAIVLDSQGKNEAAAAMYRQTLTMKEKMLGTENPSTLISMNNLAGVVERTIRNENSVLLNVALEPLYIHKEGVVDYVGDRVGDRVVDRVVDRVADRDSSMTVVRKPDLV